MKKMLVIANLYHASPRIPALTENLAKLGWRIVIITVPLSNNASEKLGFSAYFQENIKIIEVEYSGDVLNYLRNFLSKIGFSTKGSYTEQIKEKIGVTKQKSFVDRLLWLYQEIFAYPDAERTWKKPVLKFVDNLLKKENFDVILSSSPYPTSHIIAHHIKTNTGIKWIADFRDTWTGNPVYSFSKLRLFFEQRYEKRVLENVDNIITVSSEYADVLKSIHKKDVCVIPNGYQGELVKQTVLDKKFSFIYTGVVYLGKQDPTKFFKAISNLLKAEKIDKKDIVVNFYGRKENWFKVLIDDFDLNGVVVQHGLVNREEARKKQETSQILLFFNWEDKINKGISSLKLYEYLRTGRPILATGGNNLTEDERVLKETNAGICAVTIKDIECYILKAYQEFKDVKQVKYHADNTMLKKHNYFERAIILNNIL
jgi:glycosyltransferase involved in cell wall biosynthesis